MGKPCQIEGRNKLRVAAKWNLDRTEHLTRTGKAEQKAIINP
ncbi:MAG: hypothetical protein VB858_22965 [Planctomycetaceae bacterium]|jgi:hypothetical protein